MKKKKKLPKVDDLDISILSILLVDAKKPYAEIGKKLKVSGGTVHVRIRKLIDSEVVNGSNLNVDYSKLGFTVVAFLGIYLEKSSYYNGVIEELKKIPEVVEAHYTTGEYSIFSKMICKDTDHLMSTLSTKVQQITGISRTETFLSLDEGINRPLILEDVDA
jgi:Lrp/AsnC family transcriptional regulator for asnA, asnC and gidA